MATSEFFENRSAKIDKKKDIITFSFVGFLTLSILFSYSNSMVFDSNLPDIYISCTDEIDDKEYIECIISLNHKSTFSKIRIRGTSSATRLKKGYRIELAEKKSLLGMRNDDDWQLFACYLDYTRMRTKLSFDLWRSLQDDDPYAILPNSTFVNLFINKNFKGVFLLSEKDDRKLFELDKGQKSTTSSLIFQLKGRHNFTYGTIEGWSQELPKKTRINLLEKILPDLFLFVNETKDEDFFNPKYGIYSKFDKLNLINFFIFNFFILHKDFWNHNYYLMRNTAPSKFFLIPWDFDFSFGQVEDITFRADENPESEIRLKNKLYDRLLNNSEFRKDCKNHWFELREELWKEDFILDILSDMYDEIKDVLKLDLSMYEPEIDPVEYVDKLFEWIPERLEFCDSYFAKY